MPDSASSVSLTWKKVFQTRENAEEGVILDAIELPVQRPKKDQKGQTIQNRRCAQRQFSLGKKKRYLYQSQRVIDQKSKKILCTHMSNEKQHDFRLFKESKVHIHSQSAVIVDTGDTGILKFHAKIELPKKRTQKHPRN